MPHSEETKRRISEGLRRAWADPESGFHRLPAEMIERRNASIRAAYAGSRARARRENMARSSVCEICGVGGQLVNDHDHACCEYGCRSCYRGVLCSKCNVAVGMLRDDPALCDKAAAYLRSRK